MCRLCLNNRTKQSTAKHADIDIFITVSEIILDKRAELIVTATTRPKDCLRSQTVAYAYNAKETVMFQKRYKKES